MRVLRELTNTSTTVCPSPITANGSDVLALHDRVSAIFVEKLQIAVHSAETDLLQTGILDSLKLVDLILNLEQEFGIHISLDSLDVESFRSISRIANLIETQRR